ncbi:glycosyltransferase family 2 protein [Pseudomonas sp. DG56-2]|uniref:glycosyltransferase family 2 protein n=1 Tax=Pseudomonas sp. DG56-2 TaxID=2320270 RepID=UPI0010A640E0|nr:glycosyltransferase family 2 protein [Pseudomonas sp. DG56-2]
MLKEISSGSGVKVSVCIVSYNQKGYIAECLESLVTQVTDFKFEIIVSDDASTDGTADIIRDYSARYPDIVIPVLHGTNQGGANNYYFVHSKARGDYICHMDGDDVALPGKLQRSNDILDGYPDVNVVFHRMILRRGDNECQDLLDTLKIGKSKFNRADILTIGSLACHSSKMYRRSVQGEERTSLPLLDFFNDVEQVADGFAFIINEFLGVYRVGVGITKSGMTKSYYLKHLEYFLEKYPCYSAEIGANALVCSIADLKNFRRTFFKSFSLWMKCRSLRSIYVFLKSLGFRKIFRIPAV